MRACEHPTTPGPTPSSPDPAVREYGLSNTTWFGAVLARQGQKSGLPAEKKPAFGRKAGTPVTLVPVYSRIPGIPCIPGVPRSGVPLEFPYCFWTGIHGIPGIPGIPGIQGIPGITVVRPVGPY